MENKRWFSDFCVTKFQTHPLSGKSSSISECDPHAISRRNLSGTTLDLPERGWLIAIWRHRSHSCRPPVEQNLALIPRNDCSFRPSFCHEACDDGGFENLVRFNARLYLKRWTYWQLNYTERWGIYPFWNLLGFESADCGLHPFLAGISIGTSNVGWQIWISVFLPCLLFSTRHAAASTV